MRNDPPKSKRIVGENTGSVRKKGKGYYAIMQEKQANGVAKGDTVTIPKKHLKNIKDGFLIGGDYTATKSGNKKYKLK